MSCGPGRGVRCAGRLGPQPRRPRDGSEEAGSSIALLDGAPQVSLARVSKEGEKLLEDALKLDLPERAALAAELLASLDGAPDEDAEAAWAAEIARRAARARSGDDPGRPWSEVRARVRDGLAKR